MNKEVVDENHKYAHTLNLPRTEFPMRANAVVREPQLLKDVNQLYKWQEQNNTGPLWITHDGPPYANGDLHLGHALGKTLKDFVNRYKMMRGYRVSYVPGWDCHGLPIELKALAQLAQQSSTPSPSHAHARALAPQELRAYARSFALKEVEKQKQTFMSWGVMGDWKDPYLTLNPEYSSSQLDLFFDMFEKGYVYRGLRPVHWSPSSLTALADAELEYNEDHVSTSVYVAFKCKLLAALPSTVPVDNLYALIWTTTPWTLPANVAVCFNSDITYSVVYVKNGVDKRFFVMAKERVEFVAGEVELEFEQVCELSGSQFENAVFEHPFENRDSVVVFGEHVNTLSGTGLVHTAPGHGEEDFEVGKKYKLTVLSPVGADGKFTSEAGERFCGKFVLSDGTDAVLFRERNALLKEKPIKHKYPYDWRTNKPIIVRTTPQWFVDLTEVQKRASEAVAQEPTVNTSSVGNSESSAPSSSSTNNGEAITMVPPHSRSRLRGMLASRAAWCISRQRVWGVPIPVFYDEKGEALITKETVKHVVELVRKHGTDCWWSLPLSELLPPSLSHLHAKYTKGTDTMDVWFDSGASWYSVLHQRGMTAPADLYLEGLDQHRGWFLSSLLTSFCVQDRAPYKRVVTHGFVLDEHGRKMSKSVGNVIPPSRITHGGKDLKSQPAYGVDVLRFFMASSDYTKDVVTNFVAVARVAEALRNVRNRFRFMLSNTFDFSQQDLVPYADLKEVDKYLLLKLHQFGSEVQDSFENFNFTNVFKVVMNFTNQELSAFYFELVKRRLYTESPSSLSRRSAQTALYLVMDVMLKALAPLLPHTVEDVYQHWPNKPYNADSVFYTGWFTLKGEWNASGLVPTWYYLMGLREDVNKLLEAMRVKKVIRGSEEADLELLLSPQVEKLLSSFSAVDLAEIFLVSNVYFVTPDTSTPSQESTYEAVSKRELEGGEQEVRVRARPSSSTKCARCWRYRCASKEDEVCPSCSLAVAAKQ